MYKFRNMDIIDQYIATQTWRDVGNLEYPKVINYIGIKLTAHNV